MTATLAYDLKDSEGVKVGSVELEPSVFGAELNKSAVHMAVKQQLAGRRAGTASTLTRSMMKGGGKKPWKQKGTGRARAGSGISPLWPGGAVVFGPQPRKYDFKLNKEHKRQAIVSVLSDKANREMLILIESFNFSEAKAKQALNFLKKQGLTDKKVLLVASREEQNLEALALSFRNLKGVKVCLAEAVNVYDVLDHEYLLCTKAGLADLTERCRECSACSCAVN